MSEPKIAIGSFFNWLLFRCVSAFITIGGLVLIAANLRPFSAKLFCIGAFLSLFGFASSHDQIYGIADERGISFRQYFVSRFIKWGDVDAISWAHADLVYFHVKRSRRSNRVLMAQSLRGKSWAELFSAEPELVRWLTLVKPEAADGIELRYPRTTIPPLFRWNPLKASEIARFMFVLAVVMLIFSMIYAHR